MQLIKCSNISNKHLDEASCCRPQVHFSYEHFVMLIGLVVRTREDQLLVTAFYLEKH
jgi:hypothetical protein